MSSKNEKNENDKNEKMNEIIEFLKNNLKVKIETENKYITVSILLNNQIISKDEGIL
jgi:hypothetical protein